MRDLMQHQRDKDHMYECAPCKRNFYTQASLNQHLDLSDAHRSIVATCSHCNRGFTSQMARIQHQEKSTACKHLAVTLYDSVRSSDRNGLITRRAIEYSPWSDRGTRLQYSSTGRAYNSRIGKWICFCDRQFGSKRALDQHLQSPAHEARSFCCPAPDCRATFAALSALVQHVEMRSCRFGAFDIISNAIQQGQVGNLFGSGPRQIAYY